jgi:hypothetical protein
MPGRPGTIWDTPEETAAYAAGVLLEADKAEAEDQVRAFSENAYAAVREAAHERWSDENRSHDEMAAYGKGQEDGLKAVKAVRKERERQEAIAEELAELLEEEAEALTRGES